MLDKSGQLVMTPEELSQRVGAKVSQEKYQAIQNAVKEGKTGQDITHNWFTEDYEAVLASEPDGGIDLASRNALPNLVLAMYLTDYRGSEIKTREGLLRVLKGLIDGSDVKGIDAVSRLNHVAFQSLVLGQGERGYEAEVRARIGAAVKKAARTDFAPYEELYKEVKELDTYTLLPAAQWLRERVENGQEVRVENGQEVDVDIVQQGVESTINGNSAVDYFDPDQNRAMDFLNNDPQAWVSFTDMLKLSFRNDAYGRKIGDILIEDAIRIAKKVLHENRGIGFRLGDRSDEFAIVLPGSLKPEKAKNILLKIQKEIKDEYLKYSIARLPDGLAEKVKNISGVKDVSRVVRFNQNSTTVLFVKDSGDISGRLTLDRILREIGQESGEVNEVSVPYLPAGAVRFRGEGSLQDKLEASLKEAEIIQRVAKQAGELVGIEGLIEKPPIKEGATLNGVDSSKLETYIEKAKEYLPGLREFVKRHPDHGREKAKLVKLDTGLAAFMRPNLIEILEYVMELAKSADSFTFLVRGPPDSFYFVTCAKGKWQVIFVRQNILTVEGSNLQENFLSLRKASGRQGVPGKHTFKVINDFDELGHNFGNQIIKLENVSLLDAFNNQLEGAKEKGGILDEQSINAALSNASSSMNELINKNGIDFSVSFEAISIISDDYAERKNKTDTDIAEEIPGLIEVLNKNHKIVKISDDTVKFFSEYKDQWPNILAEKESSEAARSSEADAELAKADLFYSDSIKSLDNESEKDLAINQAEAAVGNSGLPAKDFNLKIFSKLGEEVYGWEIIVSQLMRLDPAVLVKHRNYLKSKVKNPVVYYIGIGGPNNSKGNLGAGPEIHIGIDVAIPLIESDFSVLVGADLESFNFQEFQNGIRINLGRVFDKTTGRCVTETLRFNKLLDNKFEATFTYDGVERKIIMYAGRDLMVADFIPEEIEGGFNVLTLNGAGFFTTPKTARRTLELLTLGKGVIFIGSDDQELYDARQTTSEFSQSISGRNIWKYLKENGYFSMQFIGVYEDYGGKRGIWCVNKNSVLADSVGQDNLPILPLAQPQGNPGGIDFRFLPIVTQSLDNLKADIRFMPQSSLQRINLTKEWSDIERLVNSGITPSAERLREYFAASYVDGSLDSDMNKIISCISDILRMEEQDCSLTDPVLKDILVVLWSGRSAKELKLAFAN
ncbi:MAG: hypothetical protein NT014_01755 [Candidatus Omnitrophica bacterium]|nr:hypothetical protein [Candidatus Omnitrophota bacterium]